MKLRRRACAGVVAAAMSCLAAGCATLDVPSPSRATEAAPAPVRSDVGTTTLRVTDASRRDLRDPAQPRQWLVQVFYPSVPTPVSGHYADDPVLLDALVRDNYYEVGEAGLRAWASAPAVAVEQARPASAKPWPVVTLSPGQGFARLSYAHLAAALVHRGYAVVVIDHPYLGVTHLPDGRLLRAADDPAINSAEETDWVPRIRDWTRDVSVVLDRLENSAAGLVPGLHLDLAHVVATGHSIGGTAALDVCSVDRRVGACLDFEGTPEPAAVFATGVERPTLMVLSRAGGRPPPVRPPGAPDLDEHIATALGRQGAPFWLVKVTGGSHTSYSDAPITMPATLTRFGGQVMEPARSMAVYAGMVDAFARAYVLGERRDQVFATFIEQTPEASRARGPATR